MKRASKTSAPLMLPGLDSAISSPVSADGRTPSDSPESPTMPTSGPGPAPASRSRPRARGAEHATLDIFGQHGSHSSESVALQSSLESRLRVEMDSLGSTLFTLTWSDAVTPSGRRIFARRASARRTPDSASTSWPTPVKEDAKSSARHGYMNDGKERSAKRRQRETLTGNAGTTMLDAARLASWPTTSATDWKGAAQPGQRRGQLPDPAIMPAGWPTPQAGQADSGYTEDHKERRTSGGHRRGHEGNEMLRKARMVILNEQANLAKRNMKSGPRTAITYPSLQAQLVASGPTPSGSPASTGSRAQLNPAHSLWLMGFPDAWLFAAPSNKPTPRSKKKSTGTTASARSQGSATRSSRGSRRSSSAPPSTPSPGPAKDGSTDP